MDIETAGRDLNATFDALADRQRRRVLTYLDEHGSATRTELADVLTGWLASDREGEATPVDRTRIELELIHVHLSKLQDSGLVEYVEATETVTLADLEPGIERILETAIEAETTPKPADTDGESQGRDSEVVDHSRDNGR